MGSGSKAVENGEQVQRVRVVLNEGVLAPLLSHYSVSGL